MGWVLFSFHLQRFYSLVVSDERATLYLEPKSSAPCGRFSEMKAGIAKERTARLLRFPGWESRRCRIMQSEVQRTFRAADACKRVRKP